LSCTTELETRLKDTDLNSKLQVIVSACGRSDRQLKIMDAAPASTYDLKQEMQDVISNEGIIDPGAQHAPNIDEEDHTLLDDKPLSMTNKTMSSIDAIMSKNRTKPLRGMLFIATICVVVLFSILLTVVAITVAAASYANQSSHQNDFDKLSNQVNELVSNFNSLSNQLNQMASESQNNNVSFILNQLDTAIQDKIETLQNNFIVNLPVAIHCGAGEWYQVAHLNMNNHSEQCPAVWREYNTSGVRACGRPDSTEGSCPGTLYTVTSGRQYSKVCGRVIGYQEDSPDAFVDSNANNASEIYMDGVSITYGIPRQHIWSYVAGVTENSASHTPNNCPCSVHGGNGPPSFVGDNYYCESGNPTDVGGSPVLLINDPLWDGQQCEGACCRVTGTNSPPWFSVQLPAPTTDMIEVRICGNEATENEDTPIALLDIYVQ
jgi:outer membrane murein-binding lipoprotein Lpp